MTANGGLGQWLEARCRDERLSLRQAATKTGLSHATIAGIRNGNQPSPESIKKLAEAFSGNGQERLALEDSLLVLAGYRIERPAGQELSQPVCRLLDKISQFSEPQLQIMERFADFIAETGQK